MSLLILIFEFFKIGLFSIGGGLATLPFLYRLHQLSGKQGAAVQIKRDRVLPAARRKQHAQTAQQHSQPIIANRFSHSSFLRSCICLYIL